MSASTTRGRTALAAPALCAVMCAAVFATSCSSSGLVRFRCDPQVNGGLLLTVDLVLVNEAEAQQIRQAGGEWFYSPLRRQLEMRTRTVAVRGGCAEQVELKRRKGHDTLAVIADYQFETADRTKGTMQFFTRDQWLGKKLDVAVHDTHLAVAVR